jgi:hypothetical protein
MLMYDECGRTTPLGPDDYFLVSFKTVETDAGVEKLEHYNIHVFSDGTIIRRWGPPSARTCASRRWDAR